MKNSKLKIQWKEDSNILDIKASTLNLSFPHKVIHYGNNVVLFEHQTIFNTFFNCVFRQLFLLWFYLDKVNLLLTQQFPQIEAIIGKVIQRNVQKQFFALSENHSVFITKGIIDDVDEHHQSVFNRLISGLFQLDCLGMKLKE